MENARFRNQRLKKNQSIFANVHVFVYVRDGKEVR